MQKVRELAVFRNSSGFLTLAEPVSDARIWIDYMWIQRDGTSLKMMPIPEGSLPSSPAVNYANCLGAPYSQACIRLVRVRVCEAATGDNCTPVRYQSLISLTRLPFALPASTTIVNAETLGMSSGTPP